MLDSNDILLKLPVIALKKNVMAQNGPNLAQKLDFADYLVFYDSHFLISDVGMRMSLDVCM